ncbi:phage antirepressor N-terminal domain-containing protein, partial [Chromatium okenii]
METSNTLIPVPFRNTTLFLVDIDGTPYTPMKPIVEGMGLDWASQFTKIKSNQRFASTIVEITMVAEDGKQREMVCFPLRKLPGWLMTIHPNKVKPDIRETVIVYQNECDDALWDYWTQGQAINPRSTFIQPDTYTLPYQPALEIQIFESAIRELRVSETSKIRMYATFCKSNGINSDFLPDYVDEPLVRAI